MIMKKTRLWLAIVAPVIALAALIFTVAQVTVAQVTLVGPRQGPLYIGGLLYASNFGQLKVPPGNVGQYSWRPGSTCQPTVGGITFNAFTANVPVNIVDLDNSANNETVTPSAVTINAASCAISIAPVHGHTDYYFTSASGGLYEAIEWALGTGSVYDVEVTPDFTLLGGTTSTITSAPHGSTSVSLSDHRTATIGTYTWNGSAYASTSGGNGITALTGDGTATGPGSAVFTLSVVNTNTGTCGDATHVGQVTLNAKGLTTACTPFAITPQVNVNGSQVSSPNFQSAIANSAGTPTGQTPLAFQFNSSNVSAYIPDITTGNWGDDYFFGHSWCVYNSSGDIAPGYGGCARLTHDLLGRKSFWGVSGTADAYSSTAVVGDFVGGFNTTSTVPKVFFLGGVNDAINFTSPTAPNGVNDVLELHTIIGWPSIPPANMIVGSAAGCTKTGFSADSSVPINAGTGGTGEKSSTNGNTISCVTPVASTGVMVFIPAPIAANGGTFTLAIDGANQTDPCSSTTTFSDTGCSAVPVYTGVGAGPQFAEFGYQFTGLASSSHTVLITVTSTTGAGNIVYFTAVGAEPTSKTGLPFVEIMGVPQLGSGTDNTSTLAYDGYNTTAVSDMSGWTNVVKADLRGGTPGMGTPDFVASAACPGGSGFNHPTSCGYQKLVQTFETAAIAAGFNFFHSGEGDPPSIAPASGFIIPGTLTLGQNLLNSGSGGLAGNINTVGAVLQGSSTYAGFDYISPTNVNPVAGTWAQLLCAYSGQVICWGQSWSTLHSTNTNAIITNKDFHIQSCPANDTTGPNGCTGGEPFYVKSHSGGDGMVELWGWQSTGTQFTTSGSGCTLSSPHGGATSGDFLISAAPCTVTITMRGASGLTANTNWSCHANDRTTGAGNTTLFFTDAGSATTAVLSVPATAVANDKIDFGCSGY